MGEQQAQAKLGLSTYLNRLKQLLLGCLCTDTILQ